MIRTGALVLWTISALAQTQIYSDGPVEGREMPMQRVQQPPEAPIGKGVLSGRVVNAKTQEPVKKAHVSLIGLANLNAVTDGNGSFTFRALPPGGYIVSANHEEYDQGETGMNSAQVTLADGEEKQDVQVKLMPGSLIHGRVVDEDDVPVPHCQISALMVNWAQGRPQLVNRNMTNTDDQGVYRVRALQQGRYVLKAQCTTTFPAPHGFMKRRDPAIPQESYAPVYSGDADPSSARAGMLLAAGAELSGVDFRVKRVPVYSVRGTLSGLEQNLLSGAQVFLIPQAPSMADEGDARNASFDPKSGEYLIRNAVAGSYEVSAFVFAAADRVYYARQNIEVGKTQLTEFELKLAPGASVSGAIEVDDPAQRFDNMQLSLQPLTPNYKGPAPMATIAGDGTFEFKSVLPGRFKLNPLPMGYIKTLTLAGANVSPGDFALTGASGPMRIAIGSKVARVDVDATPLPAPGQPMAALLIPEDESASRNVAMAGPRGELSFNGIAPGKYRILVIASANVWNLMNQMDILHALQSHCVEVEVAEGDEKKVSAPVLSADDLQKALESAQ